MLVKELLAHVGTSDDSLEVNVTYGLRHVVTTIRKAERRYGKRRVEGFYINLDNKVMDIICSTTEENP